ncbi:replication initiator protein A [Frigoriglobus tundricola]|uniref:Replication initiator protein RepA n=1 Tax=Frigoriglobus tundricola TaxID=2774151 RepID=A0A6M5Z7J2_9BACT|nr:replication initiator protein A [Frigoriglobus tundricola]QJX01354.1 replication initiator protein RepA [Frigoriglobus tundricola]
MTNSTAKERFAARHATAAFSGLDELNIAEFPLAVLGERFDDVKTLEFCDTVFDSSTGKEVIRKLTVTGSDLYGLPGHLDEDVLVVMLHLTNVAKFASRTIHFSRYDLINLLGWSHGGKHYDRLEESFRRWMSVTLHYQNAWWDKKAKAWVDRSFHILNDLAIYDRKGRVPRAELPLSSFTWGEVVFDSFLARNTKAIDLNDYFSLKLAPAKRMYRFLDKRFGARKGNVWRFDLREFACEHIGFARGYDSAQLKRKMKPSLTELEQNGFLKPLGEEERFPKGGRRGEYYIVVEKATEQEESNPPIAETQPVLTPLETALIERGVTAAVAAELVAQFPAEQIEAKLDILAWLIEAKDKRAGKSPAGYLVKSIRDDYTAPAGYMPKAEREKTQRASTERLRRQQEQERDKRSREKLEADARRAERQHVDRHLAELAPTERAALETRAIANAPSAERERLENGFLADVMRRILIDRQVLREYPLATEAK